MLLQVAEATREGQLVLGGDVLVAEEDHLVLEEGALDLGEGGVVEVGQGDAADLGAERGAEGAYTDAVEAELLDPLALGAHLGSGSEVADRHGSSVGRTV